MLFRSLCLQLAALDGYFGDRVFNAAMVRHGKPAPDLFLLAAERLAVDPQRSLAIEDSVSGIKAARAAGMTVWGFTGGGHFPACATPDDLLQAGASLIFDDMRQVQTR